jgi:hypothetical protein
MFWSVDFFASLERSSQISLAYSTTLNSLLYRLIKTAFIFDISQGLQRGTAPYDPGYDHALKLGIKGTMDKTGFVGARLELPASIPLLK